MRFLISIFMLMLVGCSSTPTYTKTETLIWSPDLKFGAKEWTIDAEGRLGKGCLVVLCHGGDLNGHWLAVPFCRFPELPRIAFDMTDVAKELRKANPGRKIILLSCNPGGYVLHGMPGLYYAPRSVVIPPFWAISPRFRAAWVFEVGSVWEFKEAI